MQCNVMQCTHICTSMYVPVCMYADMQICKTRQDKTQDAAGISKPDHKKKKKKKKRKKTKVNIKQAPGLITKPTDKIKCG